MTDERIKEIAREAAQTVGDVAVCSTLTPEIAQAIAPYLRLVAEEARREQKETDALVADLSEQRWKQRWNEAKKHHVFNGPDPNHEEMLRCIRAARVSSEIAADIRAEQTEAPNEES